MSLASGCYQVQVSHQIDDPEWDAFLAATPSGSYQQTGLWARAKSFVRVRSVRIVIKHLGTIVAGAQMLIRPFPLLGGIGYVQRGPVVDREHSGLGKLIIEELHRLAREEGVRCLAVQAPSGGEILAAQMLEWGFYQSSTSLAPVATILINLGQDLDAIMAAMRKTTRYDIRSGEKKGITVRLGTEDDLSAFYRLAQSTGERNNFSTEPVEYYRHVWRVLAPSHNLKLFLAEVNGEPVSATMMIAFGDSVTFWRSGWSGSHREYHPNEVIQWNAIKWARSDGYGYYDLGGIGPCTAAILIRGDPLPDSPGYRAHLFKTGFGGQVALFPAASVYLYNRLAGWLYRVAWQRKMLLPLMNRVVTRF